MNLATALRWLREAAGLLQAEAAEMLDLDQSTLSKCETGEREPRPTELGRVYAAYWARIDGPVPDAIRVRMAPIEVLVLGAPLDDAARALWRPNGVTATPAAPKTGIAATSPSVADTTPEPWAAAQSLQSALLHLDEAQECLRAAAETHLLDHPDSSTARALMSQIEALSQRVRAFHHALNAD